MIDVDGFDVLLERVDRAAEHRETMWAVSSEHLQAHPVTHSVKRRNNEHVMVLHNPGPLPARLTVLFGEWLYQLRAALDGLMYEVMVLDTSQDPPPDAGRLSYPLARTEDGFRNLVPRKLSEKTRRLVESTQPYHATGGYRGSALWWLHELSRLDRHRRGHLLVWRVINLHVQSNSPAVDETRSRVCDQFEAFIWRDQDLELARIATLPGALTDGDPGVHINWEVQFDVAEWVQESVASYGAWSLDDRMANAEYCVRKIIEVFRDQLTGNAYTG
ncbi:hypothetical protein [Corynebacterium sp. CCUG 51687]|uniref:hypothetical protein n=1 Tax=Corynebacterium sp. CCUG 51687 TaxID=2823897 RepID=UPI00210BD359|nr:hypothetical protein [Corynebacterium sp. CCUG 51687]MCQ4611863.1 hypothetical protein [Corynebacterium sp. CCUG 51687]